MRSCILAATFCLVALPAWATAPLDARSLGMGNAFTAVADDANGPAWNPAGLSRTKFSLYLPTQMGLFFGNNVVGITEVQRFTDVQNYWSAYQTNFANAASTPPSLPSSLLKGDFQLGADAQVSLFGLSFGVPSPIARKEWLSLGLSSWLHADTTVRFQAPELFESLNSAYLGIVPADKKIASVIKGIGDNIGGNSPDLNLLVGSVDEMAQAVDTTLGPLLSSSTKRAEITINAGTYATTMVTAAHPFTFKFGRRKESKITLGTNLKVFSSIDPMPLTGNSNVKVPLQGVDQAVGLPSTLKLSAQGNLGSVYDEFKAQIAEIKKNPSAESIKQLEGVGDNLFKNIPMSANASYTKAAATGFGCDLGAMAQINDQTTLGMALINPVVFWPAVRTSWRARWDGDTSSFASDGASTQEAVNYRETEPTLFRLGGSYQPYSGLLGIRLAADLEKEFSMIPWAFRLGGEGTLGPVALRLGTQVGGTGSMVTGGCGLNLWAVKVSMGLGLDYGLRNVSGALSTMLSF